jgi:hypothetical protein
MMVYAAVVAAGVGLLSQPAAAEQFQITIENVGVHPLSPAFFATHDATFDIFDEGAVASAEIEAIAEGGDTGPMAALAAGAPGVMDYAVAGADPIFPGEMETIMLEADEGHPYLSFASMLGVTNDGFMGFAYGDDAPMLFRLGGPQSYDFTLSYLESWDAGTEINTEAAEDIGALGGAGSPEEGGVITGPHPGILGIGDIDPALDFWGHDIAHITIVPEPASLALLGLGSLLLAMRRR